MIRVPGRPPRASASAALAPNRVAVIVVITATSRLNCKAFMKSREAKNFSNQRDEIPTGGNWI
jgi:hypothetical protein